MNELLAMRAFVKVVEAGSFTEAARQMMTTKSAITNRINQLEDHLQIELLHRSTRKLTMTDTGEIFYRRCVRILSDIEEAKSAVSSMEWGLTGTFRVSCISSFGSKYMADDICKFSVEHPNLDIDLQLQDRFCDPIQEGFDVSFQHSDIEKDILEKVDIIPLRRFVVTTPEYLEKHGIPETPEDLVRYKFAHNNNVQPDPSVPLLQDGKIIKIPFNPTILGNTVWLVKSAVMQGQGMALMPIFFIEEELISGKLVPVLPHIRVLKTTLSAYYRKTTYVPIKVKIYLNYLKRKYGEFPPWEQRLAEQRPELKNVLGL